MSGYDPSEIPLESAPPGQTNDLVNAPSQAWIPRLAIYTTLPVAVAFLFMRLYARLRSRMALGLDDYISICSVVASAGFCGVMLANVLDDMYGRHYWNIPLSAITPRLLQETSAITAVYCCASLLIKLSLCIFFRQIFLPSRISNILTMIGIILTTVLYTAFFIAWIYYSVPHSGQSWTDITFFTKVGIETPKLSVGLGAVSVFTDFYIIVIPLLAISGLNMSRARKVGVSALFATGLLACSFSVASLASRLGNYRATIIYGQPDPFWTSMSAYGLAVAEINLGIVCACVPPAFPLFKGLAEKSSYSWSSWRKYRLKYNTPSKSPKESAEGEVDISPTEQGLPKVPCGFTRTSLPFAYRAKNAPRERLPGSFTVTRDTDIEMAPYSELRSADMASMYHAYAREHSSQRNLVEVQGQV